MKRINFLAILLSFVLVACGGGEQPAVESPAPDDAVTEAPAEMPAAEQAEDDMQPQMVEMYESQILSAILSNRCSGYHTPMK